MSRGNSFGRPERITNDLVATGSATFTGTVTHSGAVVNSGTQTYTGTVNVSGTLACTGNITLSGNKQLSFAGVTPGTETAGSCITTGSTWVVHTAVGACAFKMLCSSSATSGDYATMRIRGRADAVSSGGTEAINASASSNVNNYGDLCAGYFAAQPGSKTNNSASNIITAIHAVADRTGASSGRTWIAWIDTHQETKSDAGDYLMRLSHNGTVANDGAITVYNGGRMPVLFNFEDAAGFLTDAGDAGSTKAGYLAVKTPAGTKYIQLVTA